MIRADQAPQVYSVQRTDKPALLYRFGITFLLTLPDLATMTPLTDWPLTEWPLTVSNTSSVTPAKDFEYADLLYPDFVTENCQVYCSPEYKWYYLSNHQVDELIVFKQSDTLHTASPGIFRKRLVLYFKREVGDYLQAFLILPFTIQMCHLTSLHARALRLEPLHTTTDSIYT